MPISSSANYVNGETYLIVMRSSNKDQSRVFWDFVRPTGTDFAEKEVNYPLPEENRYIVGCNQKVPVSFTVMYDSPAAYRDC